MGGYTPRRDRNADRTASRVAAGVDQHARADHARLDVDAGTVAGVAGLIRTSQQAMLDDRLAGIDTDHTHVVALIARLIDDLEERALRTLEA